MGISEIIGDKRDAILALAAKHGASNVRVFGSVAQGRADEASDVDFLVDMEPGRSLLDLGGLLMDLQDLLGREVDVVTEPALHWYIREKGNPPGEAALKDDTLYLIQMLGPNRPTRPAEE